MTGWILLAVILLLALLSFVLRLGALAGYGQEGPFVNIRVGPGYVTVFPFKKDPVKAEKKKIKKAKKEAKAAKKQPKPKKKLDIGGLLSMIWDLLPVVQDASKKFRDKVQIDKLDLNLTWGGDDPADAAIHYGYAWAAAETILDVLENCFLIKDRQVTVNLDFQLEKPRVYLQAGFSLTLAQWTAIGTAAAFHGLKVFLAHRKALFKQPDPAQSNAEPPKGELNHGKEPSHQ